MAWAQHRGIASGRGRDALLASLLMTAAPPPHSHLCALCCSGMRTPRCVLDSPVGYFAAHSTRPACLAGFERIICFRMAAQLLMPPRHAMRACWAPPCSRAVGALLPPIARPPTPIHPPACLTWLHFHLVPQVDDAAAYAVQQLSSQRWVPKSWACRQCADNCNCAERSTAGALLCPHVKMLGRHTYAQSRFPPSAFQCSNSLYPFSLKKVSAKRRFGLAGQRRLWGGQGLCRASLRLD